MEPIAIPMLLNDAAVRGLGLNADSAPKTLQDTFYLYGQGQQQGF